MSVKEKKLYLQVLLNIKNDTCTKKDLYIVRKLLQDHQDNAKMAIVEKGLTRKLSI